MEHTVELPAFGHHPPRPPLLLYHPAMNTPPPETPTVDPTARQAILDEEHLRLLRLGYIISGMLTAAFGMFGFLYAGMGFMVESVFSKMPVKAGQVHPPEGVGWIFVGMGIFMVLSMGTLAAGQLYTAKCLRERKSKTLCSVIAAFSCLFIPHGTLLGVATLMVLGRPGVARLFQ